MYILSYFIKSQIYPPFSIKGKKVAGFSNAEEEAVGLTKEVPFLLEDKLKEAGADYQKAPNFEPFVLQDGQLITGQNPQSSQKVAERLYEMLRGK